MESTKVGVLRYWLEKMITLPKDTTTKEINILTPDQQKSFISAISNHKLEVLFLVNTTIFLHYFLYDF